MEGETMPILKLGLIFYQLRRKKKKKIQSQLGAGRTTENPQKCEKNHFTALFPPPDTFFF